MQILWPTDLQVWSLLQCLPADKLAIYSLSEQSQLDGQGFLELCPTMLQQLEAGTCRVPRKEELSGDASPRPTDSEGNLWLFTNVNCKIMTLFGTNKDCLNEALNFSDVIFTSENLISWMHTSWSWTHYANIGTTASLNKRLFNLLVPLNAYLYHLGMLK